MEEPKRKLGVKGCGPAGTMDSKTAEGFYIGMTTNLKELSKYLKYQGMENLLDSIKTDSSVEHLFGEIAQMDDSEALTVERFGYLYPIVRLASTTEDSTVIKHWNRILQLPLWKGITTQKT